MSFLSVVKFVIFCFVLFTLLISLYFTLWNLCKYICKYPRMQQYVIFNVLKEYCIPKEVYEFVCGSINSYRYTSPCALTRKRFVWFCMVCLFKSRKGNMNSLKGLCLPSFCYLLWKSVIGDIFNLKLVNNLSSNTVELYKNIRYRCNTTKHGYQSKRYVNTKYIPTLLVKK
jgi:hypothetical protein